jgi:kexin
MRLTALLSILPFLASALARKNPHVRAYDTHQYYTLELSTHSLSLATATAEALGVELVEQLGGLDGHWLVRVPGQTPLDDTTTTTLLQSDPIEERWRGLRRRQNRSTGHQTLRSLTPLKLRKRVKRDGFHMPAPSRKHLRRQSFDDSEYRFATSDLGITDPMLHLQWHLINQNNRDIELNVTGLWARNITGTGVKVALIDDGLDMNSDDLKDNFVRVEASAFAHN